MDPSSYIDNYFNQQVNVNDYLPPNFKESPDQEENPLLNNQNHQPCVFSYPFIADQISFQKQVTTQSTTLLAQQRLGLPTRIGAPCIQKPLQRQSASLKSRELKFHNFTEIYFQEMKPCNVSSKISDQSLASTHFPDHKNRQNNRRETPYSYLMKLISEQKKKTPNDLNPSNDLNQRVSKRKKETTELQQNNQALLQNIENIENTENIEFNEFDIF